MHQLVEFLHHGNTQIRQIGKLNSISTQRSYSKPCVDNICFIFSVRKPRWLLNCTTRPLQTPSAFTGARLEAPGSRLYCENYPQIKKKSTYWSFADMLLPRTCSPSPKMHWPFWSISQLTKKCWTILSKMTRSLRLFLQNWRWVSFEKDFVWLVLTITECQGAQCGWSFNAPR